MKHRIPVLLLVCVLTFFTLQEYAYANSSWRWVTTSPWPVFPLVVLATLTIESLTLIVLFTRDSLKKSLEVVLFVCVANVLSFLTSYCFTVILALGAPYTTVEQLINSGPVYIVGISSALFTLLIETPVVYFGLQERISSNIKLLISILLINIATTCLVAVAERLVFTGSY